MSNRKRTPAVEARIRQRRAQGVAVADIARELHLGLATVHAALKGAASFTPKAARSKAKATRKPPARPIALAIPDPVATSTAPLVGDLSEENAAPPSLEDLRGFLASQLHSLRADLANAHGDASARGGINRQLVAVQALLAKITPPERDPNLAGMVLVPAADMLQIANGVRARLHAAIEGVASNPSAIACPACGRPNLPASVTP